MIIPTLRDEEYGSKVLLIRQFNQPPLSPDLLLPNILNALFSHTLNSCIAFKINYKFSPQVFHKDLIQTTGLDLQFYLIHLSRQLSVTLSL
jgi:hypothetical protein